MKEIVLFRGDSRVPEEVFKSGFFPKISSRNPFKLRLNKSDKTTYDLYGSRAISMTSDIQVATLFPLNEYAEDALTTYVYVMILDSALIFNTHQHQYFKAVKIIKGSFFKVPKDPINALSLLWAKEKASKFVNPERIFAAIKCFRSWKGRSWSQGMDYNFVGNVIYNPSCNASDEFKKITKITLDSIILEQSIGTPPVYTRGWHFTAIKPRDFN